MKKKPILALLLMASQVFQPVLAAEETIDRAGEEAAPASETTEASDAAPKFFLMGFILKAIASEIFSIFGKWAINKFAEGLAPHIPANSWLGPAKFVPVSGSDSGIPPSTISGEPIAAKGAENSTQAYHGLHIAIAVLDEEGKMLNLRPLNMGFKSGERFKLRVLSTFAGDLKIENINPKGVRKHIYPADEHLRIRLESGKEILIPAGPDEFFEFARTKGEEQLLITMRDPRADEKTMSHSKVYRQDEPYGSNFVQQVADKSFPAISESVKLIHY